MVDFPLGLKIIPVAENYVWMRTMGKLPLKLKAGTQNLHGK
jgi:hypothetical protein